MNSQTPDQRQVTDTVTGFFARQTVVKFAYLFGSVACTIEITQAFTTKKVVEDDNAASHKDELTRRFGVKKIGLFGSYARDEARDGSDIDIAVELETEQIFRKFFALEAYLQEHLHQEIDLGMESALKPAVRDKIKKEIIYV